MQQADPRETAARAQPCRSCGAPLHDVVVDLGMTPVSNAFRRREDRRSPEPFFPLKALVCRGCWLVQTLDTLGRDTHFHGDYAYFSSVTKGWVEHAQSFVEAIVGREGLGRESFVVEVASNDGYLLQHFVAKGVPCLGVDPA